ncbi:MAG: hypothetical protein WC655_29705, partial [Candidatus Hydrogenedentales bacterium]
MVIAIAMPRLSVALSFGQLDAAARHLAGYGRSVTAYTALEQESATVVIDLPNRQYFTLRWREQTNKLFDDTSARSNEQAIPENPTVQDLIALGGEEEMTDYAMQVKEQFDRSFMRSLEARARNVNQDSILSDIGPLFDKDFSLKDDDEENREEVTKTLLERTLLPPEIAIESIRVGNVEYTEGRVEIEVSPVGMSEFIVFILKDMSDEYV